MVDSAFPIDVPVSEVFPVSLSERSRSALYLGLSGVVGNEEAVEEMLSYFPARDVEESVTKEHLRAEFTVFRAEVQAEFAAVRSDMASEFAAVRGEMASEFAAVRAEIRQELQAEIGAVDAKLDGLSAEMHAGFRRQMAWSLSSMMATCTVLLAAFALLT